MGTSIKTSYPTNKEAFTVATELAAAITLGAAEMMVWVGANIDATHKRADIKRGLETCYDALRQRVPSFPTTTPFAMAFFTPGAATSSATTLTQGVAPPAGLTEDDVAIIYGQDFVEAPGRPAASQLFRGKHVELVEWWMEQRKAA